MIEKAIHGRTVHSLSGSGNPSMSREGIVDSEAFISMGKKAQELEFRGRYRSIAQWIVGIAGAIHLIRPNQFPTEPSQTSVAVDRTRIIILPRKTRP